MIIYFRSNVRKPSYDISTTSMYRRFAKFGTLEGNRVQRGQNTLSKLYNFFFIFFKKNRCRRYRTAILHPTVLSDCFYHQKCGNASCTDLLYMFVLFFPGQHPPLQQK